MTNNFFKRWFEATNFLWVAAFVILLLIILDNHNRCIDKCFNKFNTIEYEYISMKLHCKTKDEWVKYDN